MLLILLEIHRRPIIRWNPHLEPAEHLHKELWGKDIHSILNKVPGRQETYVSCSHVTSLQLRDLGFNEEALLVRKEYTTALMALTDMSTSYEGVVVTGQRGAGMSLLLFVITLLGAFKYYFLRKVMFFVLHPLAPLVQ